MSLPQADVVVVGAGPAGLACAYALSGLKVLVLEREARHGGRIHTLRLAGQAVDMGACFAFDPAIVPAGLAVDAGRLLGERAAMGVCEHGLIHYGDTPLHSLAGMQLDADTRASIDRFARTESCAAAARGTRAYAILASLLHQIHAGELADYDAAHQRDGLYTWYPDHWEHGNRALVDALLAGSAAELQLGAEVCDIAERSTGVEVAVRGEDGTRQLRCRAVVVATTADVAASLLRRVDAGRMQLLAATRYAGYVVVALAGPASASLPPFRSLVPLAGSPAVVMQQRSADRGSVALLVYYCGAGVDALAAVPDAELVALSRAKLAALGIDRQALATLSGSAVKRWPRASTVLSVDYRRARDAAGERARDAVFLAGDYASANPGVGYGIADAVASGIDAARRLRAYLGR